MFPDRLEKMRKKRKLTQQNMAERLGISRQGYGYYEKGTREPDLKTLQKIADILNTTTDFLLGRTNDPTTTSDANKTNQPSDNFTYFGGNREDLTEDEALKLKEHLEMYRALKEKRKRERVR
ncbi:helix-turn-helix domain-containing protein [Paenibacillus sp. MSJ-34]|uniref:helix-turn-helix domain-containing protein n=1 Tax=Paenibacillus sp. MSJ-34 TaxID=2841529 RepID=UPI001C12686D|nr:helix-turn-helix domain-containing protein [Paenibacillus sp. MSJ-34]MBU5445425.1 helix-turn-helix domain-containing protein [Paenibacillus sp. MSJ-34]